MNSVVGFVLLSVISCVTSGNQRCARFHLQSTGSLSSTITVRKFVLSCVYQCASVPLCRHAVVETRNNVCRNIKGRKWKPIRDDPSDVIWTMVQNYKDCTDQNLAPEPGDSLSETPRTTHANHEQRSPVSNSVSIVSNEAVTNNPTIHLTVPPKNHLTVSLTNHLTVTPTHHLTMTPPNYLTVTPTNHFTVSKNQEVLDTTRIVPHRRTAQKMRRQNAVSRNTHEKRLQTNQQMFPESKAPNKQVVRQVQPKSSHSGQWTANMKSDRSTNTQSSWMPTGGIENMLTKVVYASDSWKSGAFASGSNSAKRQGEVISRQQRKLTRKEACYELAFNGYKFLQGFCVRVVSKLSTWRDGLAYCMPYGSLLKIKTRAEQWRFRSILNNKQITVPGARGAWIGLKSTSSGYVWADKAGIGDPNWCPGEPSRSSGCVVVMTTGRCTGKWKTISCNGRVPYICQGIQRQNQ